jgi:hypothetical protein
VGEVFVVRSKLRAAEIVITVLGVMASCSTSSAQADPSAPAPPAAKQDQSQSSSGQTPGGDSKSDNSSATQAQDDSKQDSDKKDSATDRMMDTMNSTMTSTVDTMRRLPAQWFLGSYVPANEDLKPLTLTERRDVYIRQTYLTGASYLKRMVGAGLDQIRDAPNEWGEGIGGYGARFASRYGEFIIQNSLAATGNAILGYEPRYDYCKCTGFWPRTKHAIARNFVTYNETESEKRLQFPLYVGAFGAGAIAGATWRPSRDNPWKDGVYSVASQAGYGILSNWLQEFALDIGHKIAPKGRLRRRGSGDLETPSTSGPNANE